MLSVTYGSCVLLVLGRNDRLAAVICTEQGWGRLLVAIAALASAPACDRLVNNLGGGIGPESGLLRGRLPVGSRAATHMTRLTDGIAAKPGDPARTDLTTGLNASDAFVTWDLGAETSVRCALIDADGEDRYQLSISSDGTTFAPLWTAERDEYKGQQLRVGRDLKGAGRYLRLTAVGGDAPWTVSELSAWRDCPQTWPPLAMQASTPDDDSVRLKLWAFAILAVAYVVLYRKRAPDWAKLLGAVPAGVGIALVLQLREIWPPSTALVGRLAAAGAAVVAAVVVRAVLARREQRGAQPPPP
jgi:hypothetical protein